MIHLLLIMYSIILIFFIVYGLSSFIFIISSFFKKPSKPKFMPYKKVSVLIPCRNEEDVIEDTLNSIKAQSYPLYEVIIIDDNSSDRTSQICKNFIKKHSLTNFKIFQRKENNSSKPKAVNNVLKYVSGDIIVFFDADNSPYKNCIKELVSGFSNDRIAAVQGRVITKNGNLLSKIVSMERCSGFNVRFQGKDRISINVQFSGTIVAIRRKIMEKLGNFNADSLTEDTDLTVKIILNGYKIRYQPDAIALEEAPPNLNNYITQRTRWATGHMGCFLEYWRDILKSKLSLLDKIDTLIFLFYYFVPIICGLGIIIGILNYYFDQNFIFERYFSFIFISILIASPILELILGIIRGNSSKNLVLLPLMPFFFILNVHICYIGLYKNLKNDKKWVKTERRNGNRVPKINGLALSSFLVLFSIISTVLALNNLINLNYVFLTIFAIIIATLITNNIEKIVDQISKPQLKLYHKYKLSGK